MMRAIAVPNEPAPTISQRGWSEGAATTRFCQVPSGPTRRVAVSYTRAVRNGDWCRTHMTSRLFVHRSGTKRRLVIGQPCLSVVLARSASEGRLEPFERAATKRGSESHGELAHQDRATSF